MNQAIVDLTRALDFAARKHRDQRRKGAAAEPYINHLTEVARLVATATGGADVVSVLGALLHDTIEDTQTTREELEREFGPEVAALVAEVTDDKSLPKAERKRLQIEHAPSRSNRAKLIKIADKISNIRARIVPNPAQAQRSDLAAYVIWAEKVVTGCRGVNARLDVEFDETVKAARRLF